MPFNGVGTFTRIYSWVTDAANGLLVDATRTDTDSNDIAQGLSNCVTRDGQSVPFANLPMGGYKITGLANGVASTDSVNYGQVFSSPTFSSPTFTGAVTGSGATSFTVPTVAAGDNSTNAASTAFATALAFAAALPAQTGQSGKYITTNGSTASWALVPGQGGTTITGNQTLTVSSSAAMTVTPSTHGLYATLPDATTCLKGITLFSIYNAGDYDYGVKNSAGTQLGWIRSKTGAVIGLSDSSTAAGIWALYGLEKTGITAAYSRQNVTNNASGIVRVALDANRTCIFFAGATIYAVVYDASTQTWGNYATIQASLNVSTSFSAVLSATNQVLLVTSTSAVGATNLRAVTLSITGTTITVNSGTAYDATLASNYSSMGQIIAVGSSFVVSYTRSGGVGIRAISISGTTPTIGAESAPSGVSTAAILFASGSIVRTISWTNAGLIYAKPYTVSGSTLSAGTEASTAITGSAVRAVQNGNGNIVCNYINTSHYASIFKLTSTTEAVSAASLGALPTGITTYTDYYPITASKTAFLYISSGTWYVNILTDSAGTASAGAEITYTSSSAARVQCVTATGNNLRVMVCSNTTSGRITQAIIDCSSASPSLTSSTTLGVAYSTLNGATPTSSDIYGVRVWTTLISGATAYLLGYIEGQGAFDIISTTNALRRNVPISCSSITGVIGANTNEAWLIGGQADTNSNTITINRVESAE